MLNQSRVNAIVDNAVTEIKQQGRSELTADDLIAVMKLAIYEAVVTHLNEFMIEAEES